MFCRKCGNPIPENSNVCQHCGAAVANANKTNYENANPYVNNISPVSNVSYEGAPSQPEKAKKPAWKIIVPIVAVILVIGIVCAAVFFIKPYLDNTESQNEVVESDDENDDKKANADSDSEKNHDADLPVENSKYHSATAEDWENFNKYINITDVNTLNFTPDSPMALSKIYESFTFSSNSDIYECFFDDGDYELYFNTDYYEPSPDADSYYQPDPLALFEYSYGYAEFPAEKIDWIIENVYGLEPDRNFNSSYCYYYNDYFYAYITSPYREPPSFDVTSNELPDGRYEFVAEGVMPDGSEASYWIEGIVGFIEVDGESVWEISEISTYSTETGNSLVPDTAVEYLDKPFETITNQFGSEFLTYYYEGGDFLYYEYALPSLAFCPFGTFDEGATADDIKDLTVKFVCASESAHIYKDFYASMSYNQLKEISPEIEKPTYSDYDGAYYTSVIVDGYCLTFCWFDRPNDDTRSSEVQIAIAAE